MRVHGKQFNDSHIPYLRPLACSPCLGIEVRIKANNCPTATSRIADTSVEANSELSSMRLSPEVRCDQMTDGKRPGYLLLSTGDGAGGATMIRL